MTKIYVSPPSPYSAKVLMAATWCGIAVEPVQVNTNDDPAELLAANPLGKIPTLVTDEGEAVFDSRAITQQLNRMSGGKLYPRNAAKRLAAERLEALADGLCDCLLAHVYERRFRPEEKIHQPWLDRQWDKAMRALDLVNEAPPRLTSKLDGGQIALRAALGYMALRFEGKWERGRSKLVKWAKRFDEKFPEVAAKLPHG